MVSELCNPNFYDIGQNWRKLCTLRGVRDISDYTIRNMIFFHVVHIAPMVSVVYDAQGPL